MNNDWFWSLFHYSDKKVWKSSLFLNRLRVNERIPTQTIGNEFGIHYVSNIPLGQWSGGEVCFLDKNIEISLNSGDLLFFAYSGHGTYAPQKYGDKQNGNDDCIVPLDFNLICSAMFKK